MKVLYVSNVQRRFAHRLFNPASRLQHMPCTLLHAETREDAEMHLPDADVILLNRSIHTKFLPEDSPVYSASVPTARFFLDIWRMPEFAKRFAASQGEKYTNFFKSYDIRITYCKELFEKYCPKWADSMFWSPHCVRVRKHRAPRDIDVLFWGKLNTGLRKELLTLLLDRVAGRSAEKVDDFLTLYGLVLGGKRYRLAVLEYARYPAYHGKKLYQLISRAKICPTSPKARAPVGKYFENAACGAVTLTTDFTDKENLGFKHRENVWITKLYRGDRPRRYLGDLTYLLERPSLVEEMSKNAKRLITTRHTPEIRGRELYEFLCKKTGKS